MWRRSTRTKTRFPSVFLTTGDRTVVHSRPVTVESPGDVLAPGPPAATPALGQEPRRGPQVPGPPPPSPHTCAWTPTTTTRPVKMSNSSRNVGFQAELGLSTPPQRAFQRRPSPPPGTRPAARPATCGEPGAPGVEQGARAECLQGSSAAALHPVPTRSPRTRGPEAGRRGACQREGRSSLWEPVTFASTGPAA